MCSKHHLAKRAGGGHKRLPWIRTASSAEDEANARVASREGCWPSTCDCKRLAFKRLKGNLLRKQNITERQMPAGGEAEHLHARAVDSNLLHVGDIRPIDPITASALAADNIEPAVLIKLPALQRIEMSLEQAHTPLLGGFTRLKGCPECTQQPVHKTPHPPCSWGMNCSCSAFGSKFPDDLADISVGTGRPPRDRPFH
jgi:hypothetical protein